MVAYQTVRVWVITKNKKKMPKFSDLITSSTKAPERNPQRSRALLEIIAARTGGKVRPSAGTLVSGGKG